MQLTMIELKDFYNNGFGWICKSCEQDLNRPDPTPSDNSGLFREGEFETRWPKLATRALAKWADPAHRYLTCPRCGITELAELA